MSATCTDPLLPAGWRPEAGGWRLCAIPAASGSRRGRVACHSRRHAATAVLTLALAFAPGASGAALPGDGAPAVLVTDPAGAIVAGGAPRWTGTGDCLLCHRNRGLAAIEEDGTQRLFFVGEDTYERSVHAKVDCQGCHEDVDEIPHEKAEKVDCLRECHIVEPTREKRFSHAPASAELASSAHSPVEADGTPREHSEDYPTCKDCHEDPMYRPLSFFKKARPGISDRAVGRCRVCHESDDFIVAYYNHVTTRLHRSRSPKAIAAVCSRCHDDPAFGRRHGLAAQAVVSYEATFHGKAASYLDESVPDCLDCHVVAGESVHHMLSRSDEASSTHPDRKAELCSQEECHPDVSPRAAAYDVHAEFRPDENPVLFWFTVFFRVIAGGTLLPLCGLILLDLLRRTFPHAVLVLRRR